MKTALCLAGGGFRGIIQAGMLAEWHERDGQYDTIYACSVGSLNGAMYHANQLTALLDLWTHVRSRDVYRVAPWLLLSGRPALYDNAPLEELLRDYVNARDCCANPKPFWVSYTDILEYRAESTWTRDEEHLIRVLHASASAPILFPSQSIPGNTVVCDGGISNNFGIAQAVADGAERIVILSPTNPRPRRPRNLVDMVDISIGIAVHSQLRRELRFIEKLNSIEGFRKIEVLMIPPAVPVDVGLLDFDTPIDRKRQLIELGRRSVAVAMKEAEAIQWMTQTTSS